MAMLSSSKVGGYETGVREDFLLEESDCWVVDVACDWRESFVGKVGSAVVSSFAGGTGC